MNRSRRLVTHYVLRHRSMLPHPSFVRRRGSKLPRRLTTISDRKVKDALQLKGEQMIIPAAINAGTDCSALKLANALIQRGDFVDLQFY